MFASPTLGAPGGRVVPEEVSSRRRFAGSSDRVARARKTVAQGDDAFPLPDLDGVPTPDDLRPTSASTPDDSVEMIHDSVDAASESEEHNPFVRDLPRVIAIANQKGGVGKTTTAVNLGACLAELGYRVLVVDLDPQGNASTGLGIDPRSIESSMYDVLLNSTPIDDMIEASSVRNLFVAPANLDLAGAEIELVPAFSRETRLREAVDAV